VTAPDPGFGPGALAGSGGPGPGGLGTGELGTGSGAELGTGPGAEYGAETGLVGLTGRRVLVLNGPNLGRLGKREPSVYGTATYADLSELCHRTGKELGLDVVVRQSEYEGELVAWIHQACDAATPVVLNAGALTHYSYALADAVKMRTAPLIEVHISNIAARESFRHESVITAAATGIIAGFGLQSYVLALQAIAVTEPAPAPGAGPGGPPAGAGS
jgi:3-dehydroquinate dehydratase II